MTWKHRKYEKLSHDHVIKFKLYAMSIRPPSTIQWILLGPTPLPKKKSLFLFQVIVDFLYFARSSFFKVLQTKMTIFSLLRYLEVSRDIFSYIFPTFADNYLFPIFPFQPFIFFFAPFWHPPSLLYRILL